MISLYTQGSEKYTSQQDPHSLLSSTAVGVRNEWGAPSQWPTACQVLYQAGRETGCPWTSPNQMDGTDIERDPAPRVNVVPWGRLQQGLTLYFQD